MKSWVLETDDNQGLPFVLIDKVNAQVFAFNRDGQLLGATPVLLGLARGDIAPPGIGDRPLSAIAPEERITPSGRFVASTGENLTGGSVLWIDYAGALSLHPVVRGRPTDRRLQRLTTPTSEDNRISYGCVNVPVAFYEGIIAPTFRATTGIVYILPESISIAEVFPGVLRVCGRWHDLEARLRFGLSQQTPTLRQRQTRLARALLRPSGVKRHSTRSGARSRRANGDARFPLWENFSDPQLNRRPDLTHRRASFPGMTSDVQLDPAGLDGLGGDYWDQARREYLAGVKATTVCQRYGMSLSSFRMHARAGGWRRMDQRQCEAPPEFGEYHPDDNVSFADLADEAFLNIRRALGAGRASEASTWMRVYDNLADRARSEVMADLPDVAPPLLESRREPLRLTATDDSTVIDFNAREDISVSMAQDLDSLDSASPESNPA